LKSGRPGRGQRRQRSPLLVAHAGHRSNGRPLGARSESCSEVSTDMQQRLWHGYDETGRPRRAPAHQTHSWTTGGAPTIKRWTPNPAPRRRAHPPCGRVPARFGVSASPSICAGRGCCWRAAVVYLYGPVASGPCPVSRRSGRTGMAFASAASCCCPCCCTSSATRSRRAGFGLGSRRSPWSCWAATPRWRGTARPVGRLLRLRGRSGVSAVLGVAALGVQWALPDTPSAINWPSSSPGASAGGGLQRAARTAVGRRPGPAGGVWGATGNQSRPAPWSRAGSARGARGVGAGRRRELGGTTPGGSITGSSRCWSRSPVAGCDGVDAAGAPGRPVAADQPAPARPADRRGAQRAPRWPRRPGGRLSRACVMSASPSSTRTGTWWPWYTTRRAAAVPLERRPWVPVESVARTLDPGRTLAVSLAGDEVIRAVQAHPAPSYLVVSPARRWWGSCGRPTWPACCNPDPHSPSPLT